MKKKILLTAAIVCAAAACVLAVWLTGGGEQIAAVFPGAAEKPFANLEAADIALATVTLSPQRAPTSAEPKGESMLTMFLSGSASVEPMIL